MINPQIAAASKANFFMVMPFLRQISPGPMPIVSQTGEAAIGREPPRGVKEKKKNLQNNSGRAGSSHRAESCDAQLTWSRSAHFATPRFAGSTPRTPSKIEMEGSEARKLCSDDMSS